MEVDKSPSSSEDDDLIKKHKNKKSKEKKSKNKKHHKSKEKKRHKKRRRHSSSSENSSSEEEEDAWVESIPVTDSKPAEDNPLGLSNDKPKSSTARLDPSLDADEWSGFGSMIPTYSNDSKKATRRQERQAEKVLSSIDKPGQHERELNPYWKDGGKGLPAAVSEPMTSKPPGPVGDGGLAWLKKAFQRAKEQAKDEGRTLEDVMAERWGSLEEFYSLLEEAESKAEGSSDRPSDSGRKRESGRSSGQSFQRPDRDSDSASGDDRRHRRHRHREDDRRPHHSSSSHRHSRNRDAGDDTRSRSWMKPGIIRPSRVDDKGKQERIAESRPLAVSRSPSRLPKPVLVASQSRIEDSPPQQMETEEIEEEKPQVLTDKEMNELNAKIFKAEMLGNTELLATLKGKLEEAEKARQDFIKGGGNLSEERSKVKVVTKVILESQTSGRRKKDKPTETHKNGERVRYFPDDDKHTLKNMFEREKLNTAEDENALFSRLAAKGAKASGEYDADEIFVDKASSSRQEMKEREREVKKAFDEEKKYNKVIDNCPWCFEGKQLEKNLVVSIGQSSFLSIPPFQSLTDGHCLIIPMAHASSSTELDEDVWSEIQKFKKALVRMFRDDEQDIVFFETVVFLKKQPHMYIECVPMPKETGDLAPIYFKKAIQECETEWAQNKKVVDLKNRDVRRAVPKGLPYFSVEFADDNCGFAHVIEDEQNFPRNFAQEIIGGMMELDHQLWRKQKRDDFNKQRTKLMSFLKMWAPYDWTREESSLVIEG